MSVFVFISTWSIMFVLVLVSVCLLAKRPIALHFLNTLSKTTRRGKNRQNTPDSERSERSRYNQILCDFIRWVEPACVNISVGQRKIGVEMANAFKMLLKLQLKLSPL